MIAVSMQKYKGKNLHFRLLNRSVEIKMKMHKSVSLILSTLPGVLNLNLFEILVLSFPWLRCSH